MKYSCLTLCLIFKLSYSYSLVDSTQIPKPTGKFVTGTTVYEFTDYSRSLSFEPNTGQPRSILVQHWYPAESRDTPVETSIYAPLSNDYRHVKSNSLTRATFNYKLDKSPLIIIVPGRGVEKYGYTTIAEELASHGFSVISLDMPEIGYTIYQDGFIVKPNNAYSPGDLMRGPYEKVDAFFEKPVEIGVKDIRFVISNLLERSKKVNKDDPISKIDFHNMGIFAHSLGGRIGGAFADEHAQVKAYISMEGIPPRPIRFNGMDIPQAHLVTNGTYPYAKENYKSITDNTKKATLLLILQDMGHNSITDFPLTTPSFFGYNDHPKEDLVVLREIILLFFNDFLRGEQTKFSSYSSEKIEVLKFGID